MTEHLRLLDQYAIMFIAVVATAVFSLWASIEVHEGGHTLACVGQGYTAHRTSLVSVNCSIGDDGLFLYRFAGGGLAAAVFFSPLALWRQLKKRLLFRGFLITCVGFAVGELSKAIAEPVNFQFYTSDLGDRLFAIATWITVIGLGFFVRPRHNLDLSL